MLDKIIYDGIEEMGLNPDVRGWGSTHPFFKTIIDRVKPKIIFELGSWKGASAIHMASLCDAKIYCLDTWLGGVDHALSDSEEAAIPTKHGYPQLYFQFIHNVKYCGFQDRIIPVPNTTLNGMRYLHAKKIQPDLIYVDASHDYVDVEMDVRTAASLFPKATIFGDDYEWASVRHGLINAVGARAQLAEGGGKQIWILK